MLASVPANSKSLPKEKAASSLKQSGFAMKMGKNIVEKSFLKIIIVRNRLSSLCVIPIKVRIPTEIPILAASPIEINLSNLLQERNNPLSKTVSVDPCFDVLILTGERHNQGRLSSVQANRKTTLARAYHKFNRMRIAQVECEGIDRDAACGYMNGDNARETAGGVAEHLLLNQE